MTYLKLYMNVDCQSKRHHTKVEQQDFIQDYCSMGDRLTSTPLKQRAVKFLRTEVGNHRTLVFVNWLYSKRK